MFHAQLLSALSGPHHLQEPTHQTESLAFKAETGFSRDKAPNPAVSLVPGQRCLAALPGPLDPWAPGSSLSEDSPRALWALRMRIHLSKVTDLLLDQKSLTLSYFFVLALLWSFKNFTVFKKYMKSQQEPSPRNSIHVQPQNGKKNPKNKQTKKTFPDKLPNYPFLFK